MDGHVRLGGLQQAHDGRGAAEEVEPTVVGGNMLMRRDRERRRLRNSSQPRQNLSADRGHLGDAQQLSLYGGTLGKTWRSDAPSQTTPLPASRGFSTPNVAAASDRRRRGLQQLAEVFKQRRIPRGPTPVPPNLACPSRPAIQPTRSLLGVALALFS